MLNLHFLIVDIIAASVEKWSVTPVHKIVCLYLDIEVLHVSAAPALK